MRPASSPWLRAAGLAVFALSLSAFAWWPALAAYPEAQGGDGPFFHQMIEAIRASAFRFHELPLWNPYQCGGVPLWDNPQGLSASPLLWPLLVFDTTRAIELWYVVHSAIGFFCMWALARGELRLSVPASMIASAMWAFAGVHVQHLSGGHLIWVPYLYYPLGLFLWRRAERDLRMAVALGVLVALEMYEGGTYPLPHLALILGGETLTRAWPPARLAAIGKAAVVVVLVGFCLGASRILPVMSQLASHSRHLRMEWDALRWKTLVDMLLARSHAREVHGQEYEWPEYGAYVGPVLLGMALVGALLAGRANVWVLAMLLYTLALMAGHETEDWPWAVLKAHVYPFKEMRVPSRFNAAVMIFLVALVGIAIDRVGELARRWSRSPRVARAIGGVAMAIAIVGIADMMGVGETLIREGFANPPADRSVTPSPRFYLGGSGLAEFIDQPAQNRGRRGCWEQWAFEPNAALWEGDVPQAKSADPAMASVANVSRTQNTFSFDVSSPGPAHVLLNDTWDKGWRADVGAVVEDADLLAVDVPAGDHHVVARYWPQGLTLGLTLSALGAAGTIAFFVWDARRRRAAV